MHLLDTLKVSTAQDARTAVSALYRRTSSSASAELVRFLRLQSIGRNLILTFCGLGAILVSAAGAASGYLSSAQIIVLIFALARLASPLLLLQQSAQIILNTLPAYGALLDLNQSLGASISSQAPGPPASTPPHCGAIAMRRAGLAYGAVRGLEGVTVTIEPGAVIGVTGPSGSGKTSFLDLVAGLIEPRQGTVEVGGLPLAGDALSRHRAGLSYATAEPVIWSGSLRRNLEWAAAGIDDAAIWTALEEVGLAARLRLAGHTLDSHWEAPDRQLSMGERQRIILARILLHRPSLIILDEATNSIDAASERQILGAFRDRFSDSTLILVTHRKESLTICDRVLAFDRGRLVEDRRVRAPNQRFVPLRAGQWTQACL
jgi:ATP-binding cassette subfamily C protein